MLSSFPKNNFVTNSEFAKYHKSIARRIMKTWLPMSARTRMDMLLLNTTVWTIDFALTCEHQIIVHPESYCSKKMFFKRRKTGWYTHNAKTSLGSEFCVQNSNTDLESSLCETLVNLTWCKSNPLWTRNELPFNIVLRRNTSRTVTCHIFHCTNLCHKDYWRDHGPTGSKFYVTKNRIDVFYSKL